MRLNNKRTKEILNQIYPSKLVAATKYIDASIVKELYQNGVTIFGENKVQDFLEKYRACNIPITWHFIGTLQTNKVKYIIDKVELIHSIDSLSLVKEVQKQAAKKNITIAILLQVNIANEATKHGFNKEELPIVLEFLQSCSNITCRGLMMMAPYIEKEKTRKYFKETKQLLEKLKTLFPTIPLTELSMGMSNDYQIAIEEGATLVRIGSALFDQ